MTYEQAFQVFSQRVFGTSEYQVVFANIQFTCESMQRFIQLIEAYYQQPFEDIWFELFSEQQE